MIRKINHSGEEKIHENHINAKDKLGKIFTLDGGGWDLQYIEAV